MQAELIINGVAFHTWAKEGGISQDTIERQGRQLITLDGTLYSTSISKRSISFSAVELSDSTLATLCDALSTNPATVVYTDLAKGNRTASFYITDISATEKTVVCGKTYWRGFGFRLEER